MFVDQDALTCLMIPYMPQVDVQTRGGGWRGASCLRVDSPWKAFWVYSSMFPYVYSLSCSCHLSTLPNIQFHEICWVYGRDDRSWQYDIFAFGLRQHAVQYVQHLPAKSDSCVTGKCYRVFGNVQACSSYFGQQLYSSSRRTEEI